MRLPVYVGFDLDETDRQAIAAAFGQPGLANAELCRSMLQGAVAARLEELRDELAREHNAEAYRAKCAGADVEA